MLSSVSTRPRSTIATRSQTRSTSVSRWELRNTVAPRPRSVPMISRTSLPARRIEGRSRFVENDQFGRAEQGYAEPQPLLHPLGESLDRRVGPLRQAHQLQGFVRLPAPARPRQSGQFAVEGKDLARGHPALVAEQLGQIPDPAPRPYVAERRPQDRAAAGRRARQAQQQLHGRRLAGAVRAEEAEDLAAADGHRQARQRHDTARTACAARVSRSPPLPPGNPGKPMPRAPRRRPTARFASCDYSSIRSTIVAIPCPTPMHIAASP